jgi:hypothetical protein
MKPGRELDAKVAEAMGRLDVPEFSTDPDLAIEGWKWLEENNPWSRILLGENGNGKPSVIVIENWDDGFPQYYDRAGENFAIPGESYSHAICLAIIEVAR